MRVATKPTANRRARGVGVAGRPLATQKKKSQGRDLYRARARPAPAPRHGRPLPPSGGYWRRLVAVGGWPIRGTREGARKQCARRRGARAHAAADRPRPPPPRSAAGGGARPGRGLTDEVGRVVGGRDRWESCDLCEARLLTIGPTATCVAVGDPPPPPDSAARVAVPRQRPPGRPRGRGGCDRVRARARHPHIRRPLARPARGLDAPAAGALMVAGGARRAGSGERAGALGPPLPARCAAARPGRGAARQWPGHRRPDYWTAGAERVRQGRDSGAAQLQPP